MLCSVKWQSIPLNTHIWNGCNIYELYLYIINSLPIAETESRYIFYWCFLNLLSEATTQGILVILVASNKEHQYLPHAQLLTPQNNRRCFQQRLHCAQLDYLEDHNLNMPSFQDTAYGANVKFKALSKKCTTFNPILHKKDDWEIHTCIYPWKTVP